MLEMQPRQIPIVSARECGSVCASAMQIARCPPTYGDSVGDVLASVNLVLFAHLLTAAPPPPPAAAAAVCSAASSLLSFPPSCRSSWTCRYLGSLD